MADTPSSSGKRRRHKASRGSKADTDSTTPVVRDSPARSRPPLFSPGDLVSGRYLVARCLARGAMGEVYEVQDKELVISVALKAILPNVAENARVLRRFKSEVLLARSITHPHVCRVYDMGRHVQDGRDIVFLTMELLNGETLAALIRRHGPLERRQMLPILHQMSLALDAAHRAGIVHRDLKSSNVMIAPSPDGERVVITDFGLAYAVGAEGTDDGAEGGRVVGTPAYMAPEQVKGERVGPAADLYAFGVVLYEMLTGKLPFPAATAEMTMVKRLVGDPRPPSAFMEVRPHWERTVMRLMARDPANRFKTAIEAVEALRGEESGDTIALVRGRYHIPAERDSFVGREQELTLLGARLRQGIRLLTVVGPPGGGKTRLVQHHAWKSLYAWPGGVWFCDLSSARCLEGICTAVAESLEVTLRATDPVAQLGHAIAARGKCVVILDNFEQLVGFAASTVKTWLDLAEQARFVVTSRERLQMTGEEVVVIEPLPVADAAVKLFEERARAQRAGCPEDPECSGSAVKEIVRLLDGLPLAIELAAARTRVLTPRQLLGRLKDRGTLLSGPSGGPLRLTTLQGALDWSWDLLTPWEKAALGQCSIFEGGFTLEAAEAVVDVTVWPEAPPVIDVIQALVDKSLLRTWVAGSQGDRESVFGILGIVQEYAAAKLALPAAIPFDESGPKAEKRAFERHAAYFARFGTDDALDELSRHGGVLKRKRLERQLDNVVAACRRALDRGDGPTASATYLAASEVLHFRGPYSAALELGNRVIACPDLRSGDRGRALCACGRAAWRCGRLDEAEYCYEQALGPFDETGDRRYRGVTLRMLGALRCMQGRLDDAEKLCRQALDLAREAGTALDQSLALNALGVTLSLRGRLKDATECYKKALGLSREVGDIYFEGTVHGYLAGLRLTQGRLREAQECCKRALLIYREVGSRRDEGVGLGMLGTLHLKQRQIGEAAAALGQSLELLRDVGDIHAEGIHLGRLADVALVAGRPEEAGKAVDRGESLLRKIGAPQDLGILLCTRAELEAVRGDIEKARSALAEAEALAIAVGAGADSELGRTVSATRRKIR